MKGEGNPSKTRETSEEVKRQINQPCSWSSKETRTKLQWITFDLIRSFCSVFEKMVVQGWPAWMEGVEACNSPLQVSFAKSRLYCSIQDPVFLWSRRGKKKKHTTQLTTCQGWGYNKAAPKRAFHACVIYLFSYSLNEADKCDPKQWSS